MEIAEIRKDGNLLLVTLLLTNTLANEFLPLVMDTIFPGGLVSLILSVVLVMCFGEIIPQVRSTVHHCPLTCKYASRTKMPTMMLTFGALIHSLTFWSFWSFLSPLRACLLSVDSPTNSMFPHDLFLSSTFYLALLENGHTVLHQQIRSTNSCPSILCCNVARHGCTVVAFRQGQQ